MSDLNTEKCPYCGGSLLSEGEGLRCKFCGSRFTSDTISDVKDIRPSILVQAEADSDETEAKKNLSRKNKFEMIGLGAALVSAVLMVLTNALKLPVLMIPGFVFWAFAGVNTAMDIIRAKKEGRKAGFIRVFALMIIAVILLFTTRPK